MLDVQYIKQALSLDKIIEVMKQLGCEDYKTDKEGVLKFVTICHGGNSYKLYYYAESQMFRCYTECGCNYDIFALVQKVRNIEFPEALNWVASFISFDGFIGGYKPTETTEEWKTIKRYRMLRREQPVSQLRIHDQNILNLFQDVHYFKWYEEGISPEAIDLFKIKYDISRNRIIIPHFDIDGNLVGIKGRSLNRDEIEAGYKYLPIEIEGVSYAYENNFNLYGLHKTQGAIRRLKKIMIVESEKGVLQCESFFGENNFTVSVNSSAISLYQKQLILSMGVEEIFLAFDKEFSNEDLLNRTPKYLKYVEKMKRLASMFSPYTRVYIIWDDKGLLNEKDSPCDHQKEVLLELMKGKYEIPTKSEE